MAYHIARDQTQIGVFTEAEVRSRLARGEFRPSDLGWAEGMADWAPLGALFEPAVLADTHVAGGRDSSAIAEAGTGAESESGAAGSAESRSRAIAEAGSRSGPDAGIEREAAADRFQRQPLSAAGESGLSRPLAAGADDAAGAPGTATATAPAGRPDNNLVGAIATTLCCCMPLGVVSIVYAAQVNGKFDLGDATGAEALARKSRVWMYWGLGVGLAINFIYFAFMLAANV